MCTIGGLPGGSDGKESTAMLETQVPSLGWEDSLEKGTPVFWPGELHRLYCPWGCKESDRTEQLSLAHFHTHFLVHMM